MKGVAESGDQLGWTTAVGDFNHDGYSDLAIGAPFESIGSVVEAGAVNVLYGSATGLTSAGNQVWDANNTGDAAGTLAEYGWALAARDFNGDGYVDLAVGVPNEPLAGGGPIGAVDILYGSASGLTAQGDQVITGGQRNDAFGSALAAGNFDAAGGADLAVGAPNLTYGGKPDAGAVIWMSGTSQGLTGFHMSQNIIAEAHDRCGWSLASYNRNDDPQGYADVAVGCPGADPQGLKDAGAVDTHLGSATGLGDATGRTVSPDPQAEGFFGSSVAAADFGKDGGGFREDLIVGEPERAVDGQSGAGRVVVFYLERHEVLFQVVWQGLNGTLGTPQYLDNFGSSVTTGNFDGDGWADIAVGVLGENVGAADNAGGVNVLYGSATGITSSGNQFWSQNSGGIVGVAEADDEFGWSVTGRTE